MLRSISTFVFGSPSPQQASNSTEVNAPNTSSLPDAPENKLLQLLQSGDWDAFEKQIINADDYDESFNLEEVRFSDGKTCLHALLTADNQNMTLKFIDFCQSYQIDLFQAKDSFGRTPLEYAAMSKDDNVELVDALLNTGEKQHSDDNAALIAAALHGNTKCCQRLIQALTLPAAALEACISTAVETASGRNQKYLEAAKLLINLNVDTTKALLHAASKGNRNTIQELLLHKADATAALTLSLDRAQKTKVASVADFHMKRARCLAKEGTGIHHALAHFIATDQKALATSLIKLEPELCSLVILEAIQSNNPLLAKFILEEGANGHSALLQALIENRYFEATVLVSLGVNLNEALNFAMDTQQPAAIIDALITLGASPVALPSI
jgi:ankyrin repeat protein